MREHLTADSWPTDWPEQTGWPRTSFQRETDDDWTHKAGCLGEDTNLFYTVSPRLQQEIVQQYCSWCPVRAQCLEWANRFEAEAENRAFGIYGGLTAEQRVHLRRSKSGHKSECAA